MIDRLSLNNSYTFRRDGGSKKGKTPLKGEFVVDKGAMWLWACGFCLVVLTDWSPVLFFFFLKSSSNTPEDFAVHPEVNKNIESAHNGSLIISVMERWGNINIPEKTIYFF